MIPLIRSYIPDEVKTEVLKVLDSGFLTEGAETKEFEAACRNYIGCSQAIAVSNCTVDSAKRLKIKGEKMELQIAFDAMCKDKGFKLTECV